MLQLKNVFKNYYVDNKPLKVLKDINLTFPKQQFVTIVGPSRVWENNTFKSYWWS